MEATLPDAFEASQSGLPHGGGSAGLEGIGKAPPAGPFVKVHGMLDLSLFYRTGMSI